MNQDVNFYLGAEKVKYGLIVPIVYSNLKIPKGTIIFNNINKSNYVFVNINIPKRDLKDIGNNEFILLKNLAIKKSQVKKVYIYDKFLKKHREYSLEEFYDNELRRIKSNIENNLSTKEREFYESINLGKKEEIVIYRTMSKSEYKKLLAGKSIKGKLQFNTNSGAYGKKVFCFFDENMSRFAEVCPHPNADKILSFKVKVSDLSLSFGEYDDEDDNGNILERWRYEWTIEKYDLKKFKLLRVKDFDRAQTELFLKQCLQDLMKR